MASITIDSYDKITGCISFTSDVGSPAVTVQVSLDEGGFWSSDTGSPVSPACGVVYVPGMWIRLIAVPDMIYSNIFIVDAPSLTVSTTNNNQELLVGGRPTYCYLYEPFEVQFSDTNVTSTKLYIDIELFDSKLMGGSSIGLETKYVDFDFNSSRTLVIDLMEIVQQLHNSSIYKISSLSSIAGASQKDFSVSRFMYSFRAYTDASVVPVVVKKVPIIGLREFTKITTFNRSITSEFDLYSIDTAVLINKWSNYSGLRTTLRDISSSGMDDASSLTSIVSATSSCLNAKGGMLYWKSSYGGWMFWGIDIAKKTLNSSYKGDFASGLFRTQDGEIYIPVNYSEVEKSYSYDLKSLALTKLELMAVNGIAATPVVYYKETPDSPLELLKMSSFSAPYSNLSEGGDFQVNLQSISKGVQKTF